MRPTFGQICFNQGLSDKVWLCERSFGRQVFSFLNIDFNIIDTAQPCWAKIEDIYFNKVFLNLWFSSSALLFPDEFPFFCCNWKNTEAWLLLLTIWLFLWIPKLFAFFKVFWENVVEYGELEATLLCGGTLKEMELFGRIFMLPAPSVVFLRSEQWTFATKKGEILRRTNTQIWN